MRAAPEETGVGRHLDHANWTPEQLGAAILDLLAAPCAIGWRPTFGEWLKRPARSEPPTPY
jgi:hypothetical protein